MLPLLLLSLFLYFHLASSGNMCRQAHEFTIDVNILGTILSAENCSENCSSVLTNDTTCGCLNVTVSQEECGSPEYLIKGLSILQSRLPKASEQIKKLIGALIRMGPPCQIKMDFCLLPVMISPNILKTTLVEVAERISSTLYP